MKTTRNTITRTITLQITEEDLKRAIITELGPLTFELAQWDLAAIALGETRLDIIAGKRRDCPGVDIDFTFELEEDGGWQTETKSEDPRRQDAPDPGARSA
jgi:hypothetical protein